MDDILFEADMESSKVQSMVRKNEKVALEAMSLIARRNRKCDPQQNFENIANTIGIMAAELIQGGNNVAGIKLASAMRDLVLRHANNRIDIIKSRNSSMQ